MEFQRFHRGFDRDLLLIPGWAYTAGVFLDLYLPFDYLFLPGPNLPVMLDELPTALSLAGIKKVTILGWSMGAFLAAEFARRHPEQVEALILVSTAGSLDRAQVEQQEQAVMADRVGALERFYRRCFWSHSDALKQFRRRHLGECVKAWSHDLLLEGLSYLKKARLSLQDLSIQSLTVIHGEKDLITPLKRLPELPEDIEPVILPGACHLPFLEPEFSNIVSRLAL